MAPCDEVLGCSAGRTMPRQDHGMRSPQCSRSLGVFDDSRDTTGLQASGLCKQRNAQMTHYFETFYFGDETGGVLSPYYLRLRESRDQGGPYAHVVMHCRPNDGSINLGSPWGSISLFVFLCKKMLSTLIVNINESFLFPHAARLGISPTPQMIYSYCKSLALFYTYILNYQYDI
jgi:hypothetical protein